MGGGGRRGESRQLLRIDAGESSASTTDRIILVLEHGLPQNGIPKKYEDQKQHQKNSGKTPSKF